VRGRIDIEPNHVAQLVDERRVFGQLKLPHPMRLQPMGAPDSLHAQLASGWPMQQNPRRRLLTP